MITTGGISKRLDRLEGAGLVQRSRPQAGDGRATEIQLTPEGRRRIDAAFTEHMANEARLLAQIDPAEQASLQATLRVWLHHHETLD